MGKRSVAQKRWMFLLLLSMLSVCTVCVVRSSFAFWYRRFEVVDPESQSVGSDMAVSSSPDPLRFMKSKRVLLVSHELSLSGGPLLLMELGFLLRNVGTEVLWITMQREEGEIARSLERKMASRGIERINGKGAPATDAVMAADVVILNTAVAGKWLDGVPKESVLPKVLWWIHEMRGHYFKLDYVRHLPQAAAAMIDSHATAQYWKNRTRQRLRIEMPETYVVHLGNSKELMEVADDPIARGRLRDHVRTSLSLHDDDVLFAVINSVSRGKGQDLFLRAFRDARRRNTSAAAVIVGSDPVSQSKFEAELRAFVRGAEDGMEGRVHFIDQTEAVPAYLAASDVLVQNSQGRGECFGRITIEAMAFGIPVLGTDAGGTAEIIIHGTTGLLHPPGKDGVRSLADNIVALTRDPSLRLSMGTAGYARVRSVFLHHHMASRIALVLRRVLHKANRA